MASIDDGIYYSFTVLHNHGTSVANGGASGLRASAGGIDGKNCVQEKERRVETSSCIEDESRKKRVQSNVYSLLYSKVVVSAYATTEEEERREQASRVYKKVLEPVRTTLGYGQTAVAVRIARADDKKVCAH